MMNRQHWVAQPVSPEFDELGECPRWDAGRQEFLWVDILAGIFRRSTWQGGALHVTRTYQLDGPVGAVTTTASGGYLVAVGTDAVLLDEAGGQRPVARLADHDTAVRANDGACDPQGRFWIGLMPYDTNRTGAGRLLRLDADSTTSLILGDVTVSNGVVWNSAGDRLYYADSATNVVWLFDFEPETGSVANRRPFFALDGAVPDGMCRDDDDHLWVAAHGGGEVLRVDPDGTHVGTVTVPDVAGVTACTFGGQDRSVLFVTTAHIGMGPEARRQQPHAGRVHAVQTQLTGPPLTSFAG
jgi:sugar lactone lactonase YvrE